MRNMRFLGSGDQRAARFWPTQGQRPPPTTTPKFAAQAIRRAYDSGWKPVHYLSSVGNYVASVLVPAGIDKSIGLISTQSGKDPTDPIWTDDPAMVEWRAIHEEVLPRR